jgi:hypothetical protein
MRVQDAHTTLGNVPSVLAHTTQYELHGLMPSWAFRTTATARTQAKYKARMLSAAAANDAKSATTANTPTLNSLQAHLAALVSVVPVNAPDDVNAVDSSRGMAKSRWGLAKKKVILGVRAMAPMGPVRAIQQEFALEDAIGSIPARSIIEAKRAGGL